MTPMRAIRYVAWAAVVVAVVLLGLLTLRPLGLNPFGSPGESVMAAASIGGPFSVVDTTGATVTDASLKGHPSAIFFGYTFCPDVCPTTLSDMTVWLKELGPAADKLKVYFVTVDPERDTREQMAAYLEAFDPRISGLTGDRAAVDQLLKAFRVYSRKVDGTDLAYYSMDHTASVYLLDADGKFTGTVDYQEKSETVMAKLKRLVGA